MESMTNKDRNVAMSDHLLERVKSLEGENVRHKAALEFYGAEETWRETRQFGSDEWSSAAVRDGGQRAREALRGDAG